MCPHCGSRNVRLVAPATLNLEPLQSAFSSPAVWRNIFQRAAAYVVIAALLSRLLPDPWLVTGEICFYAAFAAALAHLTAFPKRSPMQRQKPRLR